MPSSRSMILWISVFSVTSPSADFGRLRKTSDFFGRLRTSSGIFGNDRVVCKNPRTPRIKISRLYLRKSWQVYFWGVRTPLFCNPNVPQLCHSLISEISEEVIQGFECKTNSELLILALLPFPCYLPPPLWGARSPFCY